MFGSNNTGRSHQVSFHHFLYIYQFWRLNICQRKVMIEVTELHAWHHPYLATPHWFLELILRCYGLPAHGLVCFWFNLWALSQSRCKSNTMMSSRNVWDYFFQFDPSIHTRVFTLWVLTDTTNIPLIFFNKWITIRISHCDKVFWTKLFFLMQMNIRQCVNNCWGGQ